MSDGWSLSIRRLYFVEVYIFPFRQLKIPTDIFYYLFRGPDSKVSKVCQLHYSTDINLSWCWNVPRQEFRLSLSLSRTFSIEILVYLYSFSYLCVFNMQWETQIVSQYIDRTLRCLIPNHFFFKKNTWIKKEQPTAMKNSQSKRFFSYRIIFNYLNGSLCFWSLTLKYHLNNPQNLQSMH